MMNRVLIIEDDTGISSVVRMELEHEGYLVETAADGFCGLEKARQVCWDIVLLDIMLPKMDGLTVLRNIRTFADVPIILLTAKSEEQDIIEGLESGADDYITKPFLFGELHARMKTCLRRYERSQKLKLISQKDMLTGVLNRRGFDQAANPIWAAAVESGYPVAVLMIDIDFFKKYNDVYGHFAGDEILRVVAETLRGSFTERTSVTARFGGEEFVVLLSHCAASQGKERAENARRAVADLRPACGSQITVSIGMYARVPCREDRLDDFVASADKALYMAKNTGRNKVCCI